MCDQLSLDLSPAAQWTEASFFESIEGDLKAAVEATGADPELLVFNNLKTYSSVMYNSFTCFRIKLRGKQHYISFPALFRDLATDFDSLKREPDGKYYRVSVDENHPVMDYKQFLCKIAGETINRFPKEWDCCSRYEACSDAGHCIHPDKTFSLGCGYRKILNSGRIFYGKNRNVD